MVQLAVILPTRVFGGHERMLVEWLREAVARGRLAVQLHGAGNETLARECERAGLGRPSVSHAPPPGALRDAFATWRLLGRIPREVPVLFAPGALQAAPLQWLAALLRGRRMAGYVPMAYSSRRMGFRGGALRDWLVGLVIRRVDVWITISDRQRDLLAGAWGARPPVLVVRNRVRQGEREARPAARPADEPLRVLFAGRFDANQKGLDWLCACLRASRERWAGRMRFAFKGEGAFEPELARLAAEMGAGRVELQPWGDAGAAMAKADALLLPSRYEGVPLVALEAAHHGLPIVASRDAGVGELVVPWCLFDFGDERGLWAALERLLEPARRADAVAYSRARLRESRSAASFAREVDRVVAALAAPAPGVALELAP